MVVAGLRKERMEGIEAPEGHPSLHMNKSLFFTFAAL